MDVYFALGVLRSTPSGNFQQRSPRLPLGTADVVELGLALIYRVGIETRHGRATLEGPANAQALGRLIGRGDRQTARRITQVGGHVAGPLAVKVIDLQDRVGGCTNPKE